MNQQLSDPEQMLRTLLRGRHVLLLEDHEIYSKPVMAHLKKYDVARLDLFTTGEAARDAALSHRYDVLLLDRKNPGMDGLDVLRAVRSSDGPSSKAAILIVTSNDDAGERKAGMLLGADDYMFKTVDELELIARVAQRLRHLPARDVIVNGPLAIDDPAKAVTFAGKAVKLSTTERRILTVMARNAGLPVTKSMLLKQCWPLLTIYTADWENMVRVSVSRLKKKLEPLETALPEELVPIIHTVFNEGYTMRDLASWSA